MKDITILISMKSEMFVGKYCKVSMLNGFVLYGTIINADDTGIVLETPKKTSYLNLKTISDIVPIEGE